MHSREHSNETSGFIKRGEVIGKLSDCQLLNNDCAVWSYLRQFIYIRTVLMSGTYANLSYVRGKFEKFVDSRGSAPLLFSGRR
jgi:hypothetical protein